MTENLLDGADRTVDNLDKNYLEELVGDNKKFKTVEELAKGKHQSDEYIRTLTARLDEMREDYEKVASEYKARASLEELIERMSSKQLTSNDNTDVKEVLDQPSMKPEDIDNLVSNKVLEKLREHETAKKQQENFSIVKAKLKERYGDNYASVLKQNIENLGLDEAFVNDLARNHPTVLFKTLGLDEQRTPSSSAPPKSSVRQDNFGPTVDKRTWSFYQKMRKDNPTLYNDPKTTIQMHKDAQDLGEAFMDGDFNI